jgi:hypothetical protein
MIADLIRRRPLTTFYILAFVLGAIVTGLRLLDPGAMGMLFKDMRTNPWHPNIISVFPHVLERPILWTGYLFPFAPTAAALIIVALGWGRQGMGSLLDRMRFWRNGVSWREGALVYAVMFAVYLACVTWLLLVLISREPGSGLTGMLARYGDTPLAIITFMVAALFLGPGGLLEELGWRGFMFPLLVKRLSSPLIACVVLGVLWGLWHFPREIPSILSGNPAIVASILIAFVFFKTGGSVWAAILAHNISNEFAVGLTLFTKSSLPIMGMNVDVDTPIKVTLAVIIVVCAGPRLGLKPDAEP